LETGDTAQWPRRGDAGGHPGIWVEDTWFTDGGCPIRPRIAARSASPCGQTESTVCTHRSTPPDAIARDSLLEAGLLASGSQLQATFPGSSRSQWYLGRRLAAYSCGGSCGIARRRTAFP
jgi:hypothetical protein